MGYNSQLKDAITLMRIPFSFFLMPVYWFALSESQSFSIPIAFLVFIIWHLLVFPSSNGYNSWHDKDDSPIGGLMNPPKVNKWLLVIVNTFDMVALLLSLLVNRYFFLAVLAYLIASRAYSHPAIHLKRYPILSTLTIGFFQGTVVYAGTFIALNDVSTINAGHFWLPLFVAFIFLVGSYPLTQIFQHDADFKAGIKSLSFLLGIKGTFLFAGFFLLSGVLLLQYHLNMVGKANLTFAFNLITAPVPIYFLFWAINCIKNKRKADFYHSLTMNIIASVCLSGFYIFSLING